MGKQQGAGGRQRRERGSLNPDVILRGAFELAEIIGLDSLSMPLLAKHLDVGVTSIYWHFRRKADLLSAMSDRALRDYVFATPFVDAHDWRQTLRQHAHSMRETFIANPILRDLILVRTSVSSKAARFGAIEVEKAIAGLVEAGLSPEDAIDTYSAISIQIRASVILARVNEPDTQGTDDQAPEFKMPLLDAGTTPLLTRLTNEGHRIGVADDHNFEYVIECILDRAGRLIEQSLKKRGFKAPLARRPKPSR